MVLLVALALVISPIAGTAGAAIGATPMANSTSIDDDERITITDQVSVWDRSAVTLRADSSAEGAVSVDFLADLKAPDDEYYSSFRQNLTVFKQGKTVPVHFDTNVQSSSSFDENDEVQILTAKLHDDADVGALPMSNGDLSDAFTQENLDNLNENVSFSLEPKKKALDEDGELTYQFEDEGAGMYALFVATGDGLSVDDNDLEIIDDTTIVGVEHLAVQENPSEVTVDDDGVLPGDTVTFDAEATDLEGEIDHTVILYDEETYLDFVINITDQIDGDFSASDIVIEHDIESINGVQSLEDDVSFLGMDIGAQSVSGVTHVGDIISFITSEAGDAVDADIDGPQTKATGDVVLNASSTAIADAGTTAEIDVETFGNWSEGDYRWVHVATGDSSDAFQTNTGTISLEEEKDTTPPPGPPAPPGPPDDPPVGPPEVPVDPLPFASFDELQVAAVDEKTGLPTARFSPESPVGWVALQTDTEIEVLVQGFDLSNPPEELTSVPDDTISLQSITVAEGYENTPGTIEFRVDKTTVDETKVDQGALTVLRYDAAAGEWEALETEVVGTTGDRIILEAETPRFSYFAVAETETTPETTPPTANIEILPDSTIEEGDTATLSAAGSDPGSGEIVGYEWKLDDEKIGNGEELEITPDAGEYEVELTVVTDEDESDTTTATLTVQVRIVDPSEKHRVEITVTDNDGDPIEGATVTIGDEEVTTGADGIATFDLENNVYTATITADGYETVTQEVDVDGQETEFAIQMASAVEDDGWPVWLLILVVLGLMGLAIGGLYIKYLQEEEDLDLQEEFEKLRESLNERRKDVSNRFN
ncbi:PKD domain-containing protein [Natronosalvus vescus]|uniref:PKD domain-containing protein n=1 Tax=Natronosalvus vescus TaxID=2953881 RepID=UPI002090D50E|nr:PKD domain-containing protein [Natronosalvus vescus]